MAEKNGIEEIRRKWSFSDQLDGGPIDYGEKWSLFELSDRLGSDTFELEKKLRQRKKELGWVEPHINQAAKGREYMVEELLKKETSIKDIASELKITERSVRKIIERLRAKKRKS